VNEFGLWVLNYLLLKIIELLENFENLPCQHKSDKSESVHPGLDQKPVRDFELLQKFIHECIELGCGTELVGATEL